jgi:hypothetical protein
MKVAQYESAGSASDETQPVPLGTMDGGLYATNVLSLANGDQSITPTRICRTLLGEMRRTGRRWRVDCSAIMQSGPR